MPPYNQMPLTREKSPFPLGRLNDDLLIVVLEQLREVSIETLRSCSATCHRIYKLAVPIIYQHSLSIRWYPEDRFWALICNPRSRLPRFVRSMNMCYSSYYNPSNPDPCFQFKSLQAAKAYLEEIRIESSSTIPQEFFDYVDKELPHVRLLVTPFVQQLLRDLDFIQPGIPEPNIELQGFKSKSLWRLEVFSPWPENKPLKELWNSNGKDGWTVDYCLSKLQHMEASDGIPAPNFKIKDVGFERIINGCPNLKHFASRKPHRFYVEKLELDLTREHKLPQLQSLCYIPLSRRTAEMWGQNSGWARLKVLKIMSPRCLDGFLHSGLPSLDSLTFSTHADHSVLDHILFDGYLCVNSPLKSLAIYQLSLEGIPVGFISQFSDTLEELILSDTDASLQKGRGFQSAQIRQVMNACRKLKNLSIQLPTDHQGEHAREVFLKDLVRISCLETIIIPIPQDMCRKEAFPEACVGYVNSLYADDDSRMHLHRIRFFPSDCLREHGFSATHRWTCFPGHYYARVSGRFQRFEHNYTFFESNVRSKCKEETSAKSMMRRPFSRYYSDLFSKHNSYREQCMLSYPNDMLWFAMQLDPGPGPEWARNELLPLGLVKEEHFKGVTPPSNVYFAKEFLDSIGSLRSEAANIRGTDQIEEMAETNASLEEVKSMIREELEFWKRRWEITALHGEHFLLYDVLYPRPGVDSGRPEV